MRAVLEQLETRREQARSGGGQKRIDAQHAKGKLTARERLDVLLDEGSFEEYDMYVTQRATDFGMASQKIAGDGVVTGWGTINGRLVYVFSQDFTVLGGSLSETHAQKICKIMDMAVRNGAPVIGLNDSGGARIQEGVESLSGYGQVFNRNVLLSGVVPQIGVICGPCAGGAVYSPALMDFVIMTRRSASMFICGPEVIRAVTGQHTTMEEIGSAEAHARVSGNIHFVAEDDRHALDLVRALLSYLPSNNMMDPPHRMDEEITLSDDFGIEALIPEDSKTAYDVNAIIERLVDSGSFLEIQAEFARNLVVGLGRIDGVVVGFIANQPAFKAGSLDIDASDKGARFIRFCNIFNIPLVTLVDVPGFLPGVEQEKQGIIRHGAKMLFAYGASTVPKITVIMRKAYGGAFLAMCSRDMGADLVLAWPTAEIAVMGAEGAVNVLYRKEIDEAEDKAARRRELIDEYRAEFASPYQSAARMFVHDVILPRRTRSAVSLGLRSLLGKRETRPPKKHGNIPL